MALDLGQNHHLRAVSKIGLFFLQDEYREDSVVSSLLLSALDIAMAIEAGGGCGFCNFSILLRIVRHYFLKVLLVGLYQYYLVRESIF